MNSQLFPDISRRPLEIGLRDKQEPNHKAYSKNSHFVIG